MSSDQHCSNDVPQMKLTCNVVPEELSPPEEVDFPRDEQVSFNFTPFDNQPFVTIEYDDDDQPDPLAVDETADVTNLVRGSNASRKIKIYHPFSQEVEESSMSRSPDSLYLCSPPKVAHCGGKSVELRNSDKEKVIVVSDDDDDVDVNVCPNSGRKSVQSPKFSDKNIRDDVDRNIQNRSSLVDLNDDMIHVDDGASHILMKKIAEQMRIKIEERRLAANHLKQKSLAETAFARQLARQIMKCGRQKSPVSVDHVVPMTRKQQKAAESALARRLVQEMSKGCSLEEAVAALRSITSSFRPTPVDCVNGANRGNASGRLVAGAPDGITMQVPSDGMTLQPQQMEAPQLLQPQRMEVPLLHNPCFVCRGDKRLNQSMPKGDHHSIPPPWPEASSSKASSSQQVLPSYTVAFNRPKYGNK